MFSISTVFHERLYPATIQLKTPQSTVVHELLHRAGAKALIYDASFWTDIEGLSPSDISRPYVWTNRTYSSFASRYIRITRRWIAFIFHTSGSTSGSPNLCPRVIAGLNTVVMKSHFIKQASWSSASGCDSLHVSICPFFADYLLWTSGWTMFNRVACANSSDIQWVSSFLIAAP